MAASTEPGGRCAECGEGLVTGEIFSSPKGSICKWCNSEKAVRQQQARAPAFTPTYQPPQSSGMSTLTIIRIIAVLFVLLISAAQHCK